MLPEKMLRWAWEAYGTRAAILTSFQKTGCALIDMAHHVTPQFRVITVDTLRLPEETHELMRTLETRYGITIERFRPNAAQLDQMLKKYGEYLFFDSPERQAHCCTVRKVEPMTRALEGIDVCITGLRRDQTWSRMIIPKASEVTLMGRTLLHLSPLADWSDPEINAYIKNNNVPCNSLYDKGFTSIGCVICSTPARPNEDSRAGRWRWWNRLGQLNNKEYSVHSNGSGI